jgi:lysophospholipase L1-like esterase
MKLFKEKGRIKLMLFRLILFITVIISIEALGYAGMWLYSRSFDYVANKNYFQIRTMLMGDTNPEHFPRYLSLPYLGYIPYPGLKKHGIVQNNEDGYRGDKVPLQGSGKLRVLCLGGSTTYGYTVDSPYQAYPAQLQELLSDYISHDKNLSSRFKGCEVINAGLEAGTSAEELQQYLFKYRYYKPNVVIVHSGVNDAMISTKPQSDFQLDYTHFRRRSFNLDPLTTPAKWLLKSYFISFLAIRLFYDNFTYNGTTGRDCFSIQQNQHFCKWSELNMDSVILNKQFDFYPFYRNSSSLFLSIVKDSSMLIVFPNALNKKSEFVVNNQEYDKMNSLNVSISKSLSEKYGGVYVPFAFDSIIDHTCWLDDCHLNPKGEKNKAEILFRVLRDHLK